MVSSSMAIAPSGVRAVRTTRGTTWAGTRGGPSTTWLYLMPCDIIFVALILALSSSARYSASSLTRYLSGLSGLALLLLFRLLGGRLGASPPPGGVSLGLAPGTCEPDPHVPQCARGLGDLPYAVIGHEADLGMLAAAVVGRADLPQRFTGQTFLCLSLASCEIGTHGDRHHRSVDLAILTSLADFASLEVALTLSSSMEVALTALGILLTTPLTASSQLEVSASLLCLVSSVSLPSTEAII
jgi:hypothetical protein